LREWIEDDVSGFGGLSFAVRRVRGARSSRQADRRLVRTAKHRGGARGLAPRPDARRRRLNGAKKKQQHKRRATGQIVALEAVFLFLISVLFCTRTQGLSPPTGKTAEAAERSREEKKNIWEFSAIFYGGFSG